MRPSVGFVDVYSLFVVAPIVRGDFVLRVDSLFVVWFLVLFHQKAGCFTLQ